MEDRLKLINYYTTTKDAYPTSDKTVNGTSLIECGEIAVKCATGDEGLVIVNSANQLKTIKTHDVIEKLINDSKTKIVIVDSSDTTKGIDPNKYYKWDTVTSLNITLNTPTDNTILNEYVFEFTSGTTATSLTLPSGIKWLKGEAPTIEANTTYQISIVNNLAIACYFS